MDSSLGSFFPEAGSLRPCKASFRLGLEDAYFPTHFGWSQDCDVAGADMLGGAST